MVGDKPTIVISRLDAFGKGYVIVMARDANGELHVEKRRVG